MSTDLLVRRVGIIFVFGLIFLLGLVWHYTNSSNISLQSDDTDTDGNDDVMNTADNKESDERENRSGMDGEKIPLILWWDPISGNRDERVDCGNVSCYMTVDRSRLNEQEIMAIVFYGSRFAEEGLPVPRKLTDIWAVMHEESPKNNQFLFQMKEIAELFNVSCTYKRESDYPVPTMWLKNPNELLDTKYLMPLAEKNQWRKKGLAPIVFVHSDCSVPSDRSNYVKMLMKHIDVDSYGKCENNKQLPHHLTFYSSMSPMDSSEFFKLLAQYKFALAFENAVCDDYVTEKFWRPFRLGNIPIVFGSPRIRDLLPANKSAIIINDFASIEDVVKHIKYLDEHDDEYEKYLQYKKDGISNKFLLDEFDRRDWGQGKRHSSFFEGFQCHLCHKLHNMRKLASKGLPLPVMRTKFEHFSCPEPREFNAEGQYVKEKTIFTGDWKFTEYYAQGLIHYLNKAVNATRHDLHEFARNLETKRMNKREDL